MARWVELIGPFEYRVPSKRAMVSFVSGYVAYMPEAMAAEAVSVGAGRVVDRPVGAKVDKTGAIAYVRSRPLP